MNPLAQFSLLRLLLAGGTVVLLIGMVFVGAWVEREVESGVISRAGLVTGLYVDSFISPQLQSLARGGQLRDVDRDALDRLLSGTPLGQQIVVIKIWAPGGRVIYASNPALVGRRFPVKSELASAFAGQVHAHITDLSDPENEVERQRWRRLVETYAPVRAANTGEIVAVAEFYQTVDDLARDLRAARLRSWFFVGSVTALMVLLLAALVRRANNTIVGQQTELHDKVTQLTALLTQNERLRERAQGAAARATALNERFLHKIAADLHDGPGQGIALALMRMEPLAGTCAKCPAPISKDRSVGDEFRSLNSALQCALDDLRGISQGLHLPELEQLFLDETAQRAVRDFERKAGRTVVLSVDGVPKEAPLPLKITLFRVLQESLANGFRHANGADQRVNLMWRDGRLEVEIIDDGPGFDPQSETATGHLGLAGMRERVEILGGTFRIQSAPGRGTLIRASLPVAPFGAEHE